MTWQYYNGNPYWYRGIYNLTGSAPALRRRQPDVLHVRDSQRGGAQNVGYGNRYSGFIQDSMTIGNRLTVTVGLRYDYMHTEIPVQVKKAAAGDLAQGDRRSLLRADLRLQSVQGSHLRGLGQSLRLQRPGPHDRRSATTSSATARRP